MTSEDYRQLHAKKLKPAKTSKVKSGKELLDLTSSEISTLIDTLIVKEAQYVEYGSETILCRHKGYEVEITFKMKKI